MQFGARSLVWTHRAFREGRFKRARTIRSRRPTGHVISPDGVTLSTTASAQPAASTFLGSTWGRITIITASIITGAAVYGLTRSRSNAIVEEEQTTTSPSTTIPEWHEEFVQSKNLVKVGTPREILTASPITKNLIQQDSLFDKMMEVEMVKEIHSYFDPDRKEFHSIVHLGKEVCGYPNTVHGGLTAAIMDETFGGLMFNIWRSGDLGFSLPAVTARLEVDYCNRLPQNSVVLCTTKMDGQRVGRSFWMQAELRDQSKDIVYATARACFVSPSWHRSAFKWLKGIAGI